MSNHWEIVSIQLPLDLDDFTTSLKIVSTEGIEKLINLDSEELAEHNISNSHPKLQMAYRAASRWTTAHA